MKFTIIGAGLAGSLMAILLAKRGYKVDVFEKREDIRKTKQSEGRSINLALSKRGWNALRSAGMDKYIKDFAIPMLGRMIHEESNQTHLHYYHVNRKAIYSVSRQKLNQTLVNNAEKTGNVNFFFNCQLKEINWKENIIYFKAQNDNSLNTYNFETIIGADGIGSVVRQSLEKNEITHAFLENLNHGYKELTIPSKNGEWQLFTNALHIWPRKNYMLIALPNLNGSFTCTLFMPYKGEISFEHINTEKKLNHFFYNNFYDVFPLISSLTQEYFYNPTGSLATLHCTPWYYEDKCLLIGDAAHAIVPFYGQGMNAAFEDCRLLIERLDKNQNSLKYTYENFATERITDTNAIAELAMQNFLEMRDKVTDPDFLTKKQLEKKIIEAIPDLWEPLYSMITFSDKPYSEAKHIGEKQDRILEEIMKKPDFINKWKKGLISDFIDEAKHKIKTLNQY